MSIYICCQKFKIKFFQALKAFFTASSMWVQSEYSSRTRPNDRFGEVPTTLPPPHRSVPHRVDRPAAPTWKTAFRAAGKVQHWKRNPQHAVKKNTSQQLTAKVVPASEQDNREERKRGSREPLHDPPLPPTQHRLTISQKSLKTFPERTQGCRTRRMCFGGTLGSPV